VADHLHVADVRWVACVPLQTQRGVLGTINLARKQARTFDSAELDLLQQVAGLVATAIDNTRAYQEIARLKDNLVEEKIYLEGQIQEEMHFGEIIGESGALKETILQAQTVAPSDATVLLLGETGTGKELIARAIHRLSARRDNNFIKLNCAAIPSGLLESELFGHEKGAFTGAISQKLGRLELADHGTLFLDEIGEVPLELQPKLLRVLQDHEFERLGGTRTLRVDVRVISATNRDLIQSVAERQFRSDLFYRLNVFPIRLPALRERREDIPKLAAYFVQKYAARMNKRVESIPSKAINALTRWDWPGNIRELENFIERSVILTVGRILHAPLGELKVRPAAAAEGTLQAREREHIVRVMQETRGMISGPTGAAARLGLKRTTLQSKLQRMGIKARDYRGTGPT
jgi:formate hydrogenlyase transcriptional activator